MGQALIGKYPRAAALYRQASEILGYDLQGICVEGPVEKLETTEISQPAIFVTSLAALEAMKVESPDEVAACEVTAGLSLGEYTALVFAEAMSFEDGLRVVKRRGEAMQAAANKTASGMVSILMMERSQVEEICAQASASGLGKVQIANFLCPGNLVVSGDKPACLKVAELAEQGGGPNGSPGSGRSLSYRDHEACRRRIAGSLEQGGDPDPTNPGYFQRRYEATQRPCVHSGKAGKASDQSGLVGGERADNAGDGGHQISRDRPGKSFAGIDETDRPQGGMYRTQ